MGSIYYFVEPSPAAPPAAPTRTAQKDGVEPDGAQPTPPQTAAQPRERQPRQTRPKQKQQKYKELLQQSTQKNHMYKEEIKKKNEDIEHLNKEINEKQNIIYNITGDYDKLLNEKKETIKFLQLKNDNNLKEIEIYKQELKQLKKTIEDNDNGKLLNDNIQLSNDKKAILSKLSTVKNENKNLIAQKERLNIKITEIKNEYDDKYNALKESIQQKDKVHKDKIDRYEQALSDNGEIIKNLNEQHKKDTKRIVDLAIENNNLKQQIKELSKNKNWFRNGLLITSFVYLTVIGYLMFIKN